MKFLIQFSQQHESFWLPELDSLLELNGVDAIAGYDHDRAWAIVSKGHKVCVHMYQVIVGVVDRCIGPYNHDAQRAFRVQYTAVGEWYSHLLVRFSRPGGAFVFVDENVTPIF